MSISDKDISCTESAFEIINNLETIFNGAFVKTEEHPAVDENFFTVHVKTESGSTSICFRKEDMMHRHKIASCSRCDFTTSNARLLKSHEETFHKTIEYKCSQCEFACNWESSLRQHERKAQ